MVYFQTQNPNFGKFWRTLDWKMFMYLMANCNILRTFGILYRNLVHVLFVWYFFRLWCHVSRKICQPWSFGDLLGDFSRKHLVTLMEGGKNGEKGCKRCPTPFPGARVNKAAVSPFQIAHGHNEMG
jgi:hypothetical protein